MTQEKLLKESFKKESKIPIKEHTFINKVSNETKVLTGRLLPKNDLVPDRASSHIYYIDTTKELIRLDGFKWNRS